MCGYLYVIRKVLGIRERIVALLKLMSGEMIKVIRR
jgi:hypothetical protein